MNAHKDVLEKIQENFYSSLSDDRIAFREKNKLRKKILKCETVDDLMCVKSNSDFVELIYFFIYNREADVVGYYNLVSILDSGDVTREDVLYDNLKLSNVMDFSSIQLKGVESFLRSAEKQRKFKNMKYIGRVYSALLVMKNIFRSYQKNINYIYSLQTKVEEIEGKYLDLLDYVNNLKASYPGFVGDRPLAQNQPKAKSKLIKEESTPSDFMDNFFVELSERFRGSENEVYTRNLIYKSHFIKHASTNPLLPILDIACGRGEMLEIIKECGFLEVGVELNLQHVNYCKSKGLNSLSFDVFKFLEQAKESSFSSIITTHFIEHLEFSELVNLMQLSYNALASGGILIVETPNPSNLVVSAVQFYMDPTHKSPLPLVLTKLLMEEVGFKVEEIDLTPRGIYKSQGTVEHPQLNHMLNCPQDYALKGIKL